MSRIEEEKSLFGSKLDALLAELEESPSGIAWCRQLSDLMDEVWIDIYQRWKLEYPQSGEVAFVATGGYGRQELSPGSDLDTAIVPLLEEWPDQQASLRWIHREANTIFAKDLRTKVSYTYRLVSDIPGLDAIARTNLSDSRLIIGSVEAINNLKSEMIRKQERGQFLLSRIEERKKEMERSHTSPLVVLPNLKFGAGAIRDYHAANWIQSALTQTSLPPTSQYDFVLLVRNLLHKRAGRMLDQMNYQRRSELAEQLGQTGEDFGAQLAAAMEGNHRLYQETKAQISRVSFALSATAQSKEGELQLSSPITLAQAALDTHLATRLDLDVPEFQSEILVKDAPEVIYALCGGSATLRSLDQSGLLAKILPELTATRYLMPTDESHTYTVFEHTFKTIENLESLDSNSHLNGIYHQVEDKAALILALLLHDIGKQVFGRPHSETGAEMAAEICARLSLDKKRSDHIVWLVKEHLTMSRYIRIRDVLHSDTAADFAQAIGSEQRLHMLTLLTWCDVNAVGPDVWTQVQETFLMELHARTQELFLSSPEHRAPDKTLITRRLKQRLVRAEVDPDELEAFLDSLPNYYLMSTDPDKAPIHFKLVKEARTGKSVMYFQNYHDVGVTDITISCTDRPKLLSEILGVLYALDVSLVGVRATTTGQPSVILDTITVTKGGKPLSDQVARRIDDVLSSVLDRERDTAEVLLEAGKDPNREQKFLEVTIHDRRPMILEFRAPRGRGLAYRLSRMIGDQGLNIVAARVGQWAGTGSASFYIESGSNPLPSVQELYQVFHQAREQ